MDDIYIGRQPILDKNNKIIAYEILYRYNKLFNYCHIDNSENFNATAKVLSTILNSIGINKLINGKIGFINVDTSMINNEIITNLPKEKFCLEILEADQIDNQFIQKIDELIELGYEFTLDDFVYNKKNIQKYKLLFPKIKYLKVDLQANSMINMQRVVKQLGKYDIKFLAEKVETKEDFEKLRDIGYEYFQGFYFAKPNILATKKINPAKKETINILNMIQTDEELSKIIVQIEEHPVVSINLLKFLNSVHFGFKSTITSIKQAIVLLGKQKLKNWLILLLYIIDDDTFDNPIFIMIKNRSKFMIEILKCTKYYNEENYELIYLTGILSKIDVILNTPIEESLNELNIDKVVQDAIINKKGLSGDILSLAEANENNDSEKMDKLLEKLSLSLKDLTNANLKSYLAKI